MTATTIVVIVLFWVACGVLAFGRGLATLERGFPRLADAVVGGHGNVVTSLGLSVGGPFALVLAWSVGSHGFLWTPLTLDEADWWAQKQYRHFEWVLWRHYNLNRHDACPDFMPCQSIRKAA